MAPYIRPLLLTAGTLALVLGVIGIFVPLLPTTPFVLLAAACYARSCERCHRWLVTHRWFGNFIRNWHEHHGVTRRQKASALSLLWAGIALSATFGTNSWWVRLMLVAIALCTTVYLVRLRTIEAAPVARATDTN